MPITRITPEVDASETDVSETDALETDGEISLDVFHIQEAIEVYDGSLALAIDHLFNHIKALVSMAYLPGSRDLEEALQRHPVLKRIKAEQAFYDPEMGGRSPDRILLSECQRLLDSVLEIAHLAAWPETSDQAQVELDNLQKVVPFLDYRYDNDPFPSDKDHEE